MNFKELTIEKARKALNSGEISSVELRRLSFDVIKEKDRDINAFLNIFKEDSLREAEEADKRIKEGEANILTGIPIAVKDNILIKDRIATAGSKILENYTSAYDATVTKKLKSAGVVFIGKTNLDEFAMGASTENSAFFPTKNPNDLTRSPGGSSGGSAAAVAANMCLAALGSDTAGSIRQPASFCGVVGMKPTYGNVSRFGLIALGSSLDQIGPLTKTVKDARLLYEAIRGHDPMDATSLLDTNKEPSKKSIKDLKIGVPKEYFNIKGLDARVAELVKKSIDWFGSQGAGIEEISLKNSSLGVPTYYVLLPAEASSNLARYDGVRYGLSDRSNNLIESYLKTRGKGFGIEPTRRIMTGTYVLSAGYFDSYYKQAKIARELIKEDFKKAFKNVDIIMTPTTPTTAFKLGEKVKDPLAMYAEDVFTVSVNIAGLPAISIPCAKINDLPVGLQMISPWQREDLLFDVGEFFESNYNS